ncbi:tetratricopeptide repeat protein [Parasphingorhabdus sp.]|jgi:Tfp pilus assembly protein PilF|uniref:tetratricopeptide repeat protein n=1 Tax=Parasphingorhabdus sp. TaxID=2709688 RepID=UPI003BB0070F
MDIFKSVVIMGAASTLALNPGMAIAAGGGGSGSAPSSSAPKYDASVEYQKGVAALKAKDHKNAIRSFKRSLSVAPRNASGQYLLGVSYIGQGDYKKARKPLEKAVKYDGNLIEAHRDLAITYHKLDMTDKATASLNKLTAKDSACGDGCADKDKLTKAITKVKAAMNGSDSASYHPEDMMGFASEGNGDLAYMGAVALINEKKYEAAIAELKLASMTFGPHPDILTYLGFANRKLKNFDTAEQYYQTALAVAPDHRGATEYYGELMVERGDLVGAKKKLARLERLCSFGCYEAEELRRWIGEASAS